ncbi:hypothetical protein ACFL27_01885 [candidate division CSSED10-310 bacterium]|uniref:Carboxypeptidase regulatory-like domain-containing protein n=1 Tax=candidate division CSSED10-310 bacterium TaxID=2855610 RepID=A0ABV6YRV5_UNCC1
MENLDYGDIRENVNYRCRADTKIFAKGILINASDSSPLPNVSLLFYHEDEEEGEPSIGYCKTDTQGNFSIKGITKGIYTIKITIDLYLLGYIEHVAITKDFNDLGQLRLMMSEKLSDYIKKSPD